MSSTQSARFELSPWIWPLLGRNAPAAEGETWSVLGHDLVMHDGVVRQRELVSSAQEQTRESFGFKWARRDTFESPASLARAREWLVSRYGDMSRTDWLVNSTEPPVVVDAGCGAAMSALELFKPVWDRIRYFGCDISTAVDVARQRVGERGLAGAFLQADLSQLPLAEGSVDVIFSEGVLHHTDSTQNALRSLAKLLRPGGRFMFYIYKKKGPLREFTDDHIREKLQSMTPEQAWKALEPLTHIGIALGTLNARINIPAPVALLDIPAGEIDVQRFFYWNVAKAFYGADLSFDEMNHINYDWYAPKNAHRQTPEEIRAWCAESGLEVERERIEEAGVTIIAVKR